MQGVDSLRPFLFPAISSITIMNTELEAKTNEYLRGIVANLPEKPGVYQYLNTEGTIIYVGKAKNLKKRVYSYFSKEHEPGKTRVLVSKIADIRYIVVNTEEYALFLENYLIKKYWIPLTFLMMKKKVVFLLIGMEKFMEMLLP